ncbi:hypothetical protein GCM10009754_11300 [Amycolatopsis minnesotensis]|uniref:Uncharacterized protein n=1 Tax=Amycolatopsis minnesotensis TaxID=337894 RepID=A0ABN2Q5W4_9PSEU
MVTARPAAQTPDTGAPSLVISLRDGEKDKDVAACFTPAFRVSAPSSPDSRRAKIRPATDPPR